MGGQATWVDNNSLSLQRPLILDVESLDIEAAQRTRAVILMTAGIAIDHVDSTLPFPGGRNLGDRYLEPHIDALEQLGLKVSYRSNGLRVSQTDEDNCEATIALLESGDTITENAVLTAVALNRGVVRICNASCNYMVQGLCSFLQRISGVSIEGLGSPRLTIRGSESAGSGPITYPILEDPIEAFFFIAAAVVTKSCLRITRVPVAFIALELRLLQRMGLEVRTGPRYASASGVATLCDLEILADHHPLNAMEVKIYPNIYPFGVNVDNLPAFGPIAAVSEGQTLLHDWMYEQRAPYFALLRDLEVQVKLPDKHRAHIHGPTKLRAADCRLPPGFRPASMILLTALTVSECRI